MDKNQAVIDFLITCPAIQKSSLYFNYITAKDNAKQIITSANDVSVNRKFIDGSQMKRYTFTIVDFRSLTYNPIVKQPGYSNENVEEFLDVQGIIDWISEQDDNQNYPDFGEDCVIDSMQAMTNVPRLNSVNTEVTPALAQYSVTIQIDYLDTSKRLWK